MSARRMSPTAVLAAAAQHIAAKGWCQDQPRDEDGRVCLTGALADALAWGDIAAHAMLDRAVVLEALHRAALAVAREVDPARWPTLAQIRRGNRAWMAVLITWNDAPGRTEAEVLAALGNAKRWLEAEP